MGGDRDWRASDGRGYYAYGGDFGEAVHDGNFVIDGLVFHCLPEKLRDGYVESRAQALRPGGRFFALVFSIDAFPPDADFGPRPFTEKRLREIVSRHLVVDEVRPARAWVNVPRTLPIGFEYRNVTIGPDGRAQLPSFLVSAHRS